MKVRVIADGVEHVTEYSHPVLASQAIADSGVSLYAPCGGKGICGKCRVKIGGEYTPRTADGYALACRTTLTGDSYIIYNTTASKIQVLSANDAPQIAPSGANDQLGCAIDVGTTTLACSVYSLGDGKLLYSCGAANPQSAHGADIMSRLEYASRGGAQTLRDEITAAVEALRCGGKCVVTGNTVMLSLLCGEDTSQLNSWPFSAPSLFGYEKDGVYYAPCASPFFGADAVCAAASCIKKGEPCIVADIGTNAELLCYDGEDGFLCASASAGPCFEGVGISCGMPACDGAVYKATANGRECEYSVMGGVKPRGLCGTGIADLAAFLIQTGFADNAGRMAGTYYLAENVFFTQRDMRALQLAKAAVRAGIETLLEKSGARGKIQKIYLAGGFGSALSPRTAAALGVIPPEYEHICVPAGNAALAGASRAISDPAFRSSLEELARKCEYVALAADEGFKKLFIKHIDFGGVN